MSRQERFKRCITCERVNVSPFVKGFECGECKGERIIQEIRNGGSAKEVVLCND